MGEELKKTLNKEHLQDNQQAKLAMDEELKVVLKTRTEIYNDNDEEVQKKYDEALKRYEQECARVMAFGQELKELFQKSQDTFEKQLSYISAGALALSVGFIKDIVHPIKASNYKWMLLSGWGLLIFTLLLNLVSHILAGKYAKKGAKETEDIDNTYNPNRIDKRARRIEAINWTTVSTLAGGIIFIVLYITFNAIV